MIPGDRGPLAAVAGDHPPDPVVRHDLSPPCCPAPSGEAVHLVHVTAGNPERGVMLADRVLVRPVQQAVHVAVGVVVELDLAHAELVGLRVAGVLGDLLDRLRGQLQVLVKVHVPGHGKPSCRESRMCRRTGGRRRTAGDAGRRSQRRRPASRPGPASLTTRPVVSLSRGRPALASVPTTDCRLPGTDSRYGCLVTRPAARPWPSRPARRARIPPAPGRPRRGTPASVPTGSGIPPPGAQPPPGSGPHGRRAAPRPGRRSPPRPGYPWSSQIGRASCR